MPRLKFSETGFMAVLKTRIKISRNDLYLKTSHRFSFMLNKVHVQLLRTVTHSSATNNKIMMRQLGCSVIRLKREKRREVITTPGHYNPKQNNLSRLAACQCQNCSKPEHGITELYAKARAAVWNSLLELTCIHLEMERYDIIEQIKPQNSYIRDLLLDDHCWNFIVKQCKRLPPQSVVSTYILPFGNSVFI